MKRMLFAAAATAILLAGAPTQAAHFATESAAIDAALARGTMLSSENLTKVIDLRAKGEALYKAGKPQDAENALAEARVFLGPERQPEMREAIY